MDLLDYTIDGGVYKRGDKIEVIRPIFNKKGSMTGSIGQRGVLMTDYIDLNGFVSIKINGKKYPINYAKPHCIKLNPSL